MNELSLFTGAGGGLLGTHLLGWRPIGYVEFNEYCQRVIAARINDGILPSAPIFSDIRAFISEGYAASYTGLVDVISGGFPCQPFSVAGKRAGADDERNMWPATRDCVRIIRPRYCFFENVPGLLNSGYFGTIIRDLAESGYCVRWRILSAAEVGAPHKRDRLWIVADAASQQRNGSINHSGCNRQSVGQISQSRNGHCPAYVADAERERWNGRPWSQRAAGRVQSENSGKHMANTNNTGLAQRESLTSDDGKERQTAIENSWWITEPDVGRVATGIPARVDRLKALGNAQVASVAATAWHLLSESIDTIRS